MLFERGWIDPTLIHRYTGEGRKEAADIVSNGIPRDPTGCNYSITAIMKLQTDFLEEITLLQFYAQQMGVSIDRTPKCHPEMAGMVRG